MNTIEVIFSIITKGLIVGLLVWVVFALGGIHRELVYIRELAAAAFVQSQPSTVIR